MDENDLILDFGFLNDHASIRDSYPEVYPITFAADCDVFWEWRNLETAGLPQEIADLCGACHGWLWNYMDDTQARIRVSKLAGYADLHSNVDGIVEYATQSIISSVGSSALW